MKLLISGAIAGLLIAVMPAAAAADSLLLDRFVGLLVGEYDSRLQQEQDIRNDVPAAAAHGRVNRTFARVEAPEVGTHVVVTTTSYGGELWHFDEYEFMVWTVTLADDVSSVVMSPQRFSDLSKRIPFAFAPERLAGFGPEDLEPARGGAACNIRWAVTTDGFAGRSDPCRVMSVTKNKMLTWSWQFHLSDDALEIAFSGSDDTGAVLDGSPAGSPYRLDRVESIR